MALQSLASIRLQESNINTDKGTMLPLLNQVKSQLKLPQQAETYIDVCKAIEALGGEKFEGYKPPYNNPIDWEFVKTYLHGMVDSNEVLQVFAHQQVGDVER